MPGLPSQTTLFRAACVGVWAIPACVGVLTSLGWIPTQLAGALAAGGMLLCGAVGCRCWTEG